MLLNVLALCVSPEARLLSLAIATIRSDMLTGILQTHQLALPFEDFLLAQWRSIKFLRSWRGPPGLPR